jgi:hypothetical protein
LEGVSVLILKFLLRQLNAALLIAALVLTVWGTIDTYDSLRFVAAAVSLIILNFLIERLSLNDRLLAFLDIAEGAEGASLDNIFEFTKKVERQASSIQKDLSKENVELREKLATIQDSLRQLHDLTSRNLVSFFSLLWQDTGSRKFHELRLLYALRGAQLPANGIGLDVDRNETIRLWRDALIESRTWDALSSADELWDDDEREISEAYQDLQMRLGPQNRVRRVFVLDSIDELSTRRELLRDQNDTLSSGNLRWILRTDLSRILQRRGFASHPIANDLDFAIVDNAFVLWFRLGLDPDKRLLGSRLVNDEGTLTNARNIFDIAFNNSTSIDQTNTNG